MFPSLISSFPVKIYETARIPSAANVMEEALLFEWG
jgi:hypothetical protein